MAYQRFLTNKDYEALVNSEQFAMLVNNNQERVSEAERSAEMNFLEYLDQYYEIEKLLMVGKSIRDYSAEVRYPANAFFKYKGYIYRALQQINGRTKPTGKMYWQQLTELFDIPDVERKPKFSQLATYGLGDIVKFGTEYWVCKIPCGYELDNVVIPGIAVWEPVEVTEWEANLEWEQYQVCSYKDNYYMKTEVGEGESEEVLTPTEDDTWGLIGEYSSDYNYSYSDEDHDYVVFENAVYRPVMNPNADAVVLPGNDDNLAPNVMRDDPRNANVITHMTRIACYYLHQMISPTNISETRRWAYEDSMTWLLNCSKFKINPHLPRKKEPDGRENKVDWALETYQRKFDPYENSWLI